MCDYWRCGGSSGEDLSWRANAYHYHTNSPERPRFKSLQIALFNSHLSHIHIDTLIFTHTLEKWLKNLRRIVRACLNAQSLTWNMTSSSPSAMWFMSLLLQWFYYCIFNKIRCFNLSASDKQSMVRYFISPNGRVLVVPWF